jgi:hypothetical protein
MTNIAWQSAGKFEDIRYEKAEGIAKITINRPEVRNAFRPLTVIEMQTALEDAREDLDLSGASTSRICTSRSGVAPNPSLRWWRDTPSAVATSCT